MKVVAILLLALGTLEVAWGLLIGRLCIYGYEAPFIHALGHPNLSDMQIEAFAEYIDIFKDQWHIVAGFGLITLICGVIAARHAYDSPKGRTAQMNHQPEIGPTRMNIICNKTQTTEPNQALEPTSMAVTFRAPSRTNRASHDRGSSLNVRQNHEPASTPSPPLPHRLPTDFRPKPPQITPEKAESARVKAIVYSTFYSVLLTVSSIVAVAIGRWRWNEKSDLMIFAFLLCIASWIGTVGLFINRKKPSRFAYATFGAILIGFPVGTACGIFGMRWLRDAQQILK